MAAYTGPDVFADYERVNSALQIAGIVDGTYTAPNGVNLTLANAAALNAAVEASTSSLVQLNNSWKMKNKSETKDFGTNYGLRTAVAASGYLMLKAPNAIYPSWSNDTEAAPVGGSGLSIEANESLLYTFPSKPPSSSTAFWSLTAYT